MEPVTLVVGLGNPGPRYQPTRHNAGWWMLDLLSPRYGFTLRHQGRFAASVGDASVRGRKTWFLRPEGYMNRSGQSVGAFLRYYGIDAEAMLVLHDEIDLPPGTVRLKRGGGPGGHNGLKDVIAHLDSREFARLRIGVGHPGSAAEVINYVLARPSEADRHAIEGAIDRALACFDRILDGDHQRVMTELHTVPKAAEPNDKTTDPEDR